MADLIENEPCYIYHVRDYQEHSQIIEALSLNYGALTIMAQGSKRANSPTKGLFQPFIPLKLSLKKSRSELYFLTGYEHAGNGFDFKMPYYFCASYINELLHHLYHNKDSDVALFGSYIETLEAIRDKNGIESHLRNFELTLLRSLGYSLSNCDDEGALLSFKDKYRFCFGLGFVKYDEKLLSYVTSQYKRASSYTSSSYANDSSSYNSEEDDGMLFSKSKVRGRRLESNVSNRSYGVSHMGFESFQYHNNFDPEQGELLKKYSDYLQDFLGPILNGAQIRDIIERSFALPDAARNAKLLTSSIINKLLNGREVKSRRLYREYVELKIKQKAQIQEQVQAKDATQSSASQADKPLSNNQVQDSNVTVSAPAPTPAPAPAPASVPGSDNMFDGALQATNVNTPEAYLNYALQSRAQANNSFIADAMNQEVSQSINGTQIVEVKAPYKRYVAQFAVKAEQASNDYEDIPEFNAVSENNFTVENSNELLINTIANTSDSTAKLETSYQDEQSNLSDFNLDKAAVAKAYEHSVSAQEPELNLHCEAQSVKTNSSTVSPAPDTNAINSISEVAGIDTSPNTNQHKQAQDTIKQNTNIAPQETKEPELESLKANTNDKVEAKAKSDSKDSSNSSSKSKANGADQELEASNSGDSKLETTKLNGTTKAKAKSDSEDSFKSASKSKVNGAVQELKASNSGDSKLETTELNGTTKAKAKSDSEDSFKSASKSKANSAEQDLQDSNSGDSKLEVTELNGTTKAKAKVESKGSSESASKSKANGADQKLEASNSGDSKLEATELHGTTKANTKLKAKAKSDSEDSSKNASKSKDKGTDQELEASNSGDSKLEATELHGTAKSNTKVESKSSSKSASKSKANGADQELDASNSGDSNLEATELNGTTKANTKGNTKVKAKAKVESKSASKSKANSADLELQASNSGDAKLETTKLNGTTKANTKVKAKAKSDSEDNSKSASKSKANGAVQELQASNSGDSKLEATELNGTTKANTKAKDKVESKSSSKSASKSKANGADLELQASNSGDSKLEATELNGTTKANTKGNTKVKAKAKVESKSAYKSNANRAELELEASNSSDSKLEATELHGTAKDNTKVKAKAKAKAKVESKSSSKSASKSKAKGAEQELQGQASNDALLADKGAEPEPEAELVSPKLQDTNKSNASANTKVKATANTEPKDNTKAKSKDAGESSSASKVLKRSLAKGKIKGPNGLLVAESAEDLLLGKSKNKTLMSGPKSSKNKGKAKVKRNLKDDTAASNKSGKDKVESQDGVLLQSWLFDLGAGD